MYAHAPCITPIPLPTRLTRYVLPLPLGEKGWYLKWLTDRSFKKNSRSSRANFIGPLQ